MSATGGGRLFVNVPRAGRAHWAVYKNAGADPEYPWFVEHRIVKPGHPRYAHDDHEFEYGSWPTFEAALGALAEFTRGGCLTTDEERMIYTGEDAA